MKRQNSLFCQRSMLQDLSRDLHIRCRYGASGYRGSYLFLLGLLLCVFAPKCTDAVFTAPAGCTSITWKLDGNKVQNITCSGLSLTEVPKDGKEGGDVIKLDLSNNLISTLAIDEFQHFSNLIDLDLSYNQIPSITTDTFSNLTSLQYLNLAANEISSLPWGIFADTQLITLDLSHLNLGEVTKDHLKYLTQLKEIDLSYNNLSFLEQHLFKDLGLEKIDLSWNQIDELDFRKVFHVNNIMKSLILNNNKIVNVDKDFLNDASSLTNLDLSHNQISSLNYEVFEDCPLLETLYLDYNLLETLPDSIFKKTSFLKYLYMSNNRLSTLPDSLLGKNEILEYLDLSGNSFTTIDQTLWQLQTSILLDVSDNPFECTCTVRDFLYNLKYDTTRGLLNEDTTTCTDTNSVSYIFLDYNADICAGNLGSNCSVTSQCMARNSECTNNVCVCSSSYYDNNGNTYSGLCKAKVELGVACISINNMCKMSHSTCGSSGKCECQSAYYDSDGSANVGGECLPKLPLYSSCNETYQCATANAECFNNNCTCATGFYDFDNSKLCQDEFSALIDVIVNRKKRDANSIDNSTLFSIDNDTLLEGPSSFFSCYPNNASNIEVNFTKAEVVSSDEGCKIHCFQQNDRYYHLEDSVCLCGIETAKVSCCKLVMSPCNGRTYLGPTTLLSLAGIEIKHVPQLYAGVSHTFSVTTTLSVIDQIKWSFGDSQTVTPINASSDKRDHTYTHSGQFWLTVSACVQAYGACENATIPIRVQVPAENLTTYITGKATADVSSNLSSTYATFPMGYDFEYYWSKDFNGVVTKKKGCLAGWTAHRYSCIKLGTSTADYVGAQSACTVDGGRLLQIDFLDELSEIVSALSASSKAFFLGAKKSGGVWQWSSDNSKTVFSDEDLTSTLSGDCVALVGSSQKLTSANCAVAGDYACMTDPVDCPRGGELMSNGYCYVLASTKSLPINTWQGANSVCQTSFGGWLANITDDTAHTKITDMLTSASVSEAWFGLSDQQWEGYYLWADDTSFDFNSPPYKPTVESVSEDCFVTTSSKTWSSHSCLEMKDYVCQYSENIERVTVPNYLMGVADIGITAGSNLQQVVATDSFPSSVANSTDLLLFPGWTFTRSGSVRSWNFRSIDVVSGSYDISFQVFRPSCSSGHLTQAGCDGTLFATCSLSPPPCSSSSICSDLQYFCYLSETCIFFNESCTCNSQKTFASAVSACRRYGTVPAYELVSQTSVTISNPGENFYTVPAGDISIQEHDIIGVQFPAGKNVMKCENLPNGLDQQTSYRASALSNWLVKWDAFPSGYTPENLTCYLQAVYTQDLKRYLPTNLGYSSSVGNYDLSINILEGDSKQLPLWLEESVADLYWVYPTLAIANTSADSLGTVYTEWNKVYDFTLRAERGTNLQSVWSFNSSQTKQFTNSCTSAVAAVAGIKCNSSLYWSEKPFASFRYNTSSVGNQTLEITLTNSLGSTKKTLKIRTEKVISGLSLSLATTSLIPNNVAVGHQSDFTTSITSGTGVSYSFTVGGSPVVSSSSNSSFAYTFNTAGTYTVEATASNILGIKSQTLNVYAKKAAQFTNCQFLKTPYTAAVGLSSILEVQCTVEVDAEVSAVWLLNDRSTNFTSAVTKTSASTQTWSQAVTFTSVSAGVIVSVIVQDPFEVVTTNTSVDVYNAIPSVAVVTNSSDIYPNTTVQISADVPVSPGSYGAVTFTYDFGDGSSITNTSGVIAHSYSTPGNYTVTVTASNGPSNQTATTFVTVYEEVSGLVLTYNGPKQKIDAVQFTATVSSGNFLFYRFVSSKFDVTSSANTYTHMFSTEGDYNVTVTASNALSHLSNSITAYILNASDLRISNFTMDGAEITDCIETTVAKLFTASVIHYDAANVVFDWNFGDGSSKSNAASAISHSYSTAGNYTVVITAKYLAAGAQVALTEDVCVQERISGPAVVIASPLALPSTGSVSKNVTVTVVTGNPLNYAWSTNATTVGSQTSPTFPVEFSAEGTYFISVVISNEINSMTKTKIIQVVEDISSMVITCAACIDKNGEFYVLNNTAYDYEVVTGTGSSITFAWNFGDTTSGTGTTNKHTYSAIGKYNLTVTGSNPVAASYVQFVIVHVEVPVTDVTLRNYYTDWTINARNNTLKDLDIAKTGKFQAAVKPTGMNVEYSWVFETGLAEVVTTSELGQHNYTTKGLKQCTVTVSNAFSNITSSPFTFYVIEKISAMNITVGNGDILSESLTYNLTVNTLQSFTISSTQIVIGTETYFIAIRNSRGMLVHSTSLAKANPTTEFNFTSTDVYDIQATLGNSIGNYVVTYQVEAMTPVTNPYISASAGEDGNITLGSSITLTGGAASGKGLHYNWFYAVTPATELFPTPSNTQAVTLTPASAGIYIVTLEVSNYVTSPIPVNYTINVMVGVSGVAISVTMTYTDAVKVGDNLTFTGTVAAGTGLSYSWDALSNGMSLSTGTSNDFSFHFVTQALFNITLEITNFASGGSDYREIYSLFEVPVFTLQAGGATFKSDINTYVSKTNDKVNFTSSLSNTDFITFDWKLDSLSVVSTEVFSKTFISPAEYSITLNVSNKISAQTNSVSLIVQDPLEGFSIQNCMGTFLMSSVVTLTATYTKGTNISISWDIENNPSATGIATTVTYPAVGTYSINVTGNNYVSQDLRFCTLEIQGRVANLQLTMSQYRYVGFPVTFTVTGDYISPAQFTWTFFHGVTKTSNVSSLDLTFTAAGVITLEVTVANNVSSSKVDLTFVVEELACKIPVLTVDGTTNRVALRSRDIEISVDVNTDGCTAYTSVNKWTVYEATSCAAPLTMEKTLDSTVQTNTPILTLPKKTLAYGSYCLIFNHRYNNTPVDQSESFNLTIMASSLQALLNGGDELGASEGSSLTLDASLSYDPDEVPGTDLKYSWTCSQSMGTATASAVCSKIGAVTSAKETLTGLTLTSGDVYIVNVTVSATGRSSGSASQKVTISPSTTPVVYIVCVSCKAIGHYFITSSKSIAIEGTCVSGCTSPTYQWTVTESISGAAVTVDSTQTTTGTSQKNFVLKHSVLQANKQYTFKLEATDGSGTGISLLSLPPASQPSGGFCTISPSSGIVPLQSLVTVSCQNWVDADQMSAIYYKIVISSTTTYKKPYIAYYGTKAENEIYVVPFSGTSYGNVDVKVTAINDYGAETDGAQRTISFTQPMLLANQSDKVDFIVDQMIRDMKTIVNQNNPSLLLQYCMAVLSYLNDQSENSVGTPAERMVIRDIIAKALSGLPRTSIQNIQQMATAVEYLAEYPEEISADTLSIVSSEIESLAEDLESRVVKGIDQRDVEPVTLLSAVTLMQEALRSTTTVTSDAVTLAKFGNVEQYALVVSNSVSSKSYSSDEERIQSMIIKSVEFSTQLMIVPLKAQLADEEEVEITMGDGSIAYGKHVSRDKLTESYTKQGIKIIVPHDILSFTTYAKDSVFQLVSISTTNQYDFGTSSVMPLNTKTVSSSLHDTSGTSISVSNLPEGEEVSMYLFDEGISYYEVNDSGLIYSAGYQPLTKMNFTTGTLEESTNYEFALTMPEESGVAVHIMIRVNYTSTVGQLQATLYKNGVAYTSGASNTYARPKTIDRTMMDDPQYDHTEYTFFIPDYDISSTDAFKVRLKTTQTTEVSVGTYFSKCEFFNVATASWDNDGCSPRADSIASVISCKCNHMTSFGGSLLVSPDEISFKDLTQIDISSNPVAIITCSVILGLYIILVIAFRRMDVLDVKRISCIPLCGKDGSFKYEVTIVTGRLPGAGTSAHVGIRLIGEYGRSARQHVSKAGAFGRNCSDTFIVAYDVNLGDLRKIQVWHDNSGTSPSWYMSHVIVNDLQTDQKYYFFCNKWLSLEEENGTIQRELKVAGSSEMSNFGHRMKTALFNSLADKHLWISLFNRPAQSRFTRVQRITCCVTIIYTFVMVNAMWYGLLKKDNTQLGFGDFGWEEVVLALVSNIVVLPVSIGLVFLFKKSRSKPNFFDQHQKPQTAQTIEIENLCGNSQAGSFESTNTGAIPYDLERESTIDSVPHAALGLHRSRHVAKTHRENTDDSLIQKRPSVAVTNSSSKSPLWNEDGIMKWPETVPAFDSDSRPSTGSTMAAGPSVRQSNGKPGGSVPAAARKSQTIKKGDLGNQLLEELDKLENDLKESESRSVKSSGSKKSSTSLRKPTMHKARWGSLEDILQSDDESVAESSGKVKKRGSTTSQSTTRSTRFNPRADPRINGNGSSWPKSRESMISAVSGVSDANRGITEGLRPGYYGEMSMVSRDIPIHKEKCTMPPWCIYIAYILCVVLSIFSVIIVILYCFKFGKNESLEWVLALILSLILSFIVIEPLKALLIAVYVVATFKNVEQDEDDDFIDIQPVFDSSFEKFKEVKFKPISGYALLQAKEEGRKVHRMNIMIRQFIAYVFYLWLIMVIVYVNFRYDSYLMTKHVEHDIIGPTTAGHLNYTNLTSIDEFWDWSQNVFVDALYRENLTSDEEHGFLLGAARMRQIRGLAAKCMAANAASGLGASSLTDRTCHGEGNYDEDTDSYAEGWNQNNSNFSWRHYSARELGSTHKVGHVATYGGGGYPHVLGTSAAETDGILADLKDKSWIDLRTRAVIFEFTLYSPGSDITSLVALLVEFPLTGGVISSYEIQSEKLLWFQERTVEPLMVLECILFLVIVYSVIHLALQIREHGRQFFKDVWNWYEMLTTLMAVVSIGMYLGCVIEATHAFNNFLSDQTGFTNFERAVYMHVGTRYLNAWLLFLLMYKVVKQLRFIKFMYVYEKTLSTAVGYLVGTGFIYIILLLVYAQVGYLMYGRIISGFESVGHSILTLVVMIRGSFDFWPMLDHQPVFSHFYVYSYYSFAYGIMIALVISILISTYKVVRSQMYYKATLEMQDYEMIDFMLKRFKLWTGLQKPKPAFRRVRFPGLPSVSSRSSSSYSHRSSASQQSTQSVTGPQFSEVQLRSMMARMAPTWQAVLKRMDKIVALDQEEETLVKRAENEMKELNWKCRINELERQHKELLSWKNQPSASGKPPAGDTKQRQSTLKRLPLKDSVDRKAPATVTGATNRTATSAPAEDDKGSQGRRPLSDQGARLEAPSTSKRRSSSTEKSKIQTFFKSLKPSKPAWNK